MGRKELENCNGYYLANMVDLVIDGYESQIGELEADNAKKLRQIENGMKGARILEGRIKELEEELVRQNSRLKEYEEMVEDSTACIMEAKAKDSRIQELERLTASLIRINKDISSKLEHSIKKD